MLRLGSVRIGEEELRWMRWGGQEVVLGVRWSWEEVPVLLDLHSPLLLKWEHHDDLNAGLSATISGAKAYRTEHQAVHVEIVLTRPPGWVVASER